MTTPDKIEEIRKICIASNPEIVKLEFGCEFYWEAMSMSFTGHYTIVDIDYHNKKKDEFTVMCVHKERTRNVEDVGKFDERIKTDKDFEIIGRSIRLADILLTIKEVVKEDKNLPVTHLLTGYVENRADKWKENPKSLVKPLWNLRHDTLEEQSKECISFIHNVLIKK